MTLHVLLAATTVAEGKEGAHPRIDILLVSGFFRRGVPFFVLSAGQELFAVEVITTWCVGEGQRIECVPALARRSPQKKKDMHVPEIFDVSFTVNFSAGTYVNLDVDEERVVEAMRSIALCHNVTPVVEGDSRVYQASSPDEVALVQFSESVGLILNDRSLTSVHPFPLPCYCTYMLFLSDTDTHSHTNTNITPCTLIPHLLPLHTLTTTTNDNNNHESL